jgi:hypothetical protein
VQGVGPFIWVVPPISIVNAGNTNAVRIATVHVPFPLNNSTLGVPHFVQWLISDSGTRSGSDAAKFTPFKF